LKLILKTELISRFANRKTAKVAMIAAAILGTGAVIAAAAAGSAVTPPSGSIATVYSSMDDIYALVRGLLTGPLGKILAAVCLIAGAAAGAIKRDFVWLLIGAFMALALGYGPGVIENLFAVAL